MFNVAICDDDKNFIQYVEDIIKELEIYKQGKIYLQSLSSMLPPLVLNPKPQENILDMAAAPRRKNNRDGSFVWK